MTNMNNGQTYDKSDLCAILLILVTYAHIQAQYLSSKIEWILKLANVLSGETAQLKQQKLHFTIQILICLFCPRRNKSKYQKYF
jgi:hypothetical protein